MKYPMKWRFIAGMVKRSTIWLQCNTILGRREGRCNKGWSARYQYPGNELHLASDWLLGVLQFLGFLSSLSYSYSVASHYFLQSQYYVKDVLLTLLWSEEILVSNKNKLLQSLSRIWLIFSMRVNGSKDREDVGWKSMTYTKRLIIDSSEFYTIDMVALT